MPEATTTTKDQAVNQKEIDRLVGDGVTILKRLNTDMRDLAVVVVEIRSHFKRSDGMTDWKGSSQAYRDVIAKMYKEAGIPADQVSGIQSALRYHIGNALRAKAPAKELAAVGLDVKDPKTKARENARAKKEEEASSNGSDAKPKDPNDGLKTAFESLTDLQETELEDMTLRQLQRVVSNLRKLSELSTKLRFTYEVALKERQEKENKAA